MLMRSVIPGRNWIEMVPLNLYTFNDVEISSSYSQLLQETKSWPQTQFLLGCQLSSELFDPKHSHADVASYCTARFVIDILLRRAAISRCCLTWIVLRLFLSNYFLSSMCRASSLLPAFVVYHLGRLALLCNCISQHLALYQHCISIG